MNRGASSRGSFGSNSRNYIFNRCTFSTPTHSPCDMGQYREDDHCEEASFFNKTEPVILFFSNVTINAGCRLNNCIISSDATIGPKEIVHFISNQIA